MRAEKDGKALLMVCRQQDGNIRPLRAPARGDRGFSMIEIIMAMLVGVILTAIAIPQVRSGMNSYRLNSAVAMTKWAIQSTRFQALEKGYAYQVAFSATNLNYKIQYATDNVTFTDVKDSSNNTIYTPLSAWPMTLNADTTIKFQANGFVSVTTGSTPFSLTYQGTCQQIAVSNYGSVSVTLGTVGTSPC
jgi:prepilin-type N-terminal cleavage/methylation domain-containing protein